MATVNEVDIKRSVNVGGSAVATSVEEAYPDGAQVVKVAVPAGAVNQAVALPISAARLRTLHVLASQAITLKTNSATSPTQTIALVAGMPLDWTQQTGYFANPITADVTTIYLSNPGTASGSVVFVVGQNVS